MSLGEGPRHDIIKFNPSDNSLVSQIKQKSAELIDLCVSRTRATPVWLRMEPLAYGRWRNDALRRRRDVGGESRDDLKTHPMADSFASPS